MKNVKLTYEELLIENESLKKLLSEKNSTETELKESEEKWKAICLNTPSILVLLDLEGKILFINRTVPDLNKEDVIGTDILLYFPQEDCPLLSASLKKVIETGKTDKNIVVYNTKQGETHYFDVRINPIFVDGKVTWLISSSTDITERKKAEIELAELHEKINSLLVDQNIILKNAPIGISKIINRKQIWINEEMEKLLGYSKAEMIGQTTRLIYPSDEAYEKIGKEAYPELSTGLTYITVQDIICKNSEHKIVRFIGKAVDGHDMSKGIIWLIEDITKQKQAEEALKESEARFREVLDNSLDISYKRNLQTDTYEYISPVFEKISGFTPDEFISLSSEIFLDQIHHEDKPEVERVRARSLTNIDETSFQVDYRFKHKNGHYIWIHNQFIVVRDKQGNPSARIGSISDITERKKTELALQHSKKQYEDLFELSETSLTILDYEGKYLMINDKSANQFGLPKSEIIGKSIYDLLPTDVAQKYVEQNKNLIDSGGRRGYEDSFLLNGKVKTFLIVDQCIKNEDCQNYALLSSALDITNRKQEEKLLTASEEKFRLLIENMQIGVLLQGPNAEIIMSNSKALELLGLTESQLLGKTSFDPDWNVIHEDGTPFPGNTRPVLQAIATRRAVHDVVMGVYRPLNADRIWLLVNAEPQLDDKGDVLQVVCLFLDITSRKQAELIINEQNLQLNKLIVQKDKFFSIIAHDLRGPMGVFLGFTDHMVYHLDTMTLKEIQKINESMRKSATNLFRLLENLLDWSKVEQGLMPFNPMTVFLLPILNETLSVAIGLASNKGIDLTYKIPEDLEVFADWNMLKTVVRNLLSNAIKFTPKGGKVILSTEISGYKCIKICIKDNGIGMDKDLVNNLFKLDKSTGRKGTEGELSTGLGLILCKDFIKSHGGRIWVESIEGKGSSFYFTLPMKDVED